MHKTSHNHSPNQRTLRTTKKQGENPPLKGKQQAIQKRAVCTQKPAEKQNKQSLRKDPQV